MSLIIPIVVAAVLIGVFAKRMTPYLWAVMALVMVITVAHFYIKH